MPDNPVVDSKVLTPKQDANILKTAGQRRVNLLWEMTQCYIAVMVCTCGMLVMCYLATSNPNNGEDTIRNAAMNFISLVVGSVIGFYFGRTNHQKIGGVGDTEAGETRGEK